jgi:hypothetical protein
VREQSFGKESNMALAAGWKPDEASMSSEVVGRATGSDNVAPVSRADIGARDEPAAPEVAVQAVLAEWRAAERRVASLPLDHPDREDAVEVAGRLRDEYHRAADRVGSRS